MAKIGNNPKSMLRRGVACGGVRGRRGMRLRKGIAESILRFLGFDALFDYPAAECSYHPERGGIADECRGRDPVYHRIEQDKTAAVSCSLMFFVMTELCGGAFGRLFFVF